MALSEKEQRLLAQMEAALAAEDPRLANALRGGRRGWHQGRLVLSGIGFVVGVAGLVIGMEIHPLLSVAGFVIMLVSAVVGLNSWRQPGDAVDPSPSGRSPREERKFTGGPDDWRQRRDGDLG